ncbi:MAG: helix-turn-helix transcriptional regulator [Thermoanaerobaculia bacterium]
MNAKQRLALAEQLRAAIEASELSRYEIAKRTGLSQAALSRFMAGASLYVETLEKIAGALGIEVTLSKPKAAARKPRPSEK